MGFWKGRNLNFYFGFSKFVIFLTHPRRCPVDSVAFCFVRLKDLNERVEFTFLRKHSTLWMMVKKRSIC